MRPQSIINFDRCYLGVIALNVLNTFLSWSQTKERIATAGLPPGTATGGLAFGLIVGVGISLLLWYFIAKKGSVVAKWILTVLFVLGLIAVLVAAAGNTFPTGLPGIVSIVVLVLQAVSVYLLFRPDSKRWFDGRGDLGDTFS